MVRISKQGEKRARFPRKNRDPIAKTGPKKDNLPDGFKARPNAIAGEHAAMAYIPKIK